MKRVMIPILMLALCALILGGYGCLAPTATGIIDSVTPTPITPPEPTANPSATAPPPPSPATGPTIPAVGDQAPDFTLPSAWGDIITLSSHEGQKNIVLVFYRTGG